MTHFPETLDDLKSSYNRKLIFLFLVSLFFSWNWAVAENTNRDLLFIGFECVQESRVDVKGVQDELNRVLGLRNAP